MNSGRVVITGLGAIAPLGLDMPTVWENLISGKSGITRVEGINPEVEIFGVVKDFNPEDYMHKKTANRMDRFAQFAVAAAAEAITDAELDELFKNDAELRDQTGVLIGSGNGGQISFEEQHLNLHNLGPSTVSPFTVSKVMLDGGSVNVAAQNGLRGPSQTVTSACATGLDAIIFANMLIKSGDAKIMVAGASEAANTPMVVAAFANTRALTRDYNDNPEGGCRPFDKDRSGFVLSEGAGVLVLEDLEHAEKRGASIYAEIIGYCQNNNAGHLTAPDAGNQARAIKSAIEKAGIRPDEVDYINAHGTSTLMNDIAETEAIKSALGQHASRVLISSTKSMTGHLIGATGALETAICAAVVRNGIVPPTINLDNPDIEAGCDLNYVPNKAIETPVEVAVNNSFGFGGHNAVLVLRKYQMQ